MDGVGDGTMVRTQTHVNHIHFHAAQLSIVQISDGSCIKQQHFALSSALFHCFFHPSKYFDKMCNVVYHAHDIIT